MSTRPEPLLRLRIASAFYRFRESLFLLPALIVLGGVVLAEISHAVDDAIEGGPVPGTLAMSSNTATWLLSTVAGAMITTAGVVFSLTVVSLQLASSQFSPRVMRTFVRDRLSQVVIGLLIATFVYCVLTLRHVDADPETPAPPVSLTLAIVLAVATVLLIVAHLDHLARGLQVGHVVHSISVEGRAVIAARRRSRTPQRPVADEPADAPADALTVPAPRDGWVTQAATDRMLAAVPAGTRLRLETRIGAYIHEGEPLVTLWPAPSNPSGVLRRLSATVTVTDTRTMQQDVDFAIRQLVDIGLRALSAAINDPTTAVEVILRLGGLLRRLLVADLPPTVLGGPDGRTLIRPWDLSHEDYIEHSFDQLRQAAPSQPHVATALLRVLKMLITFAEESGRPQHVPALRRQLRLLLEALEQQPGLQPADLDRMRMVASEDAPDPADHSIRR